jgi:hypothetical protein
VEPTKYITPLYKNVFALQEIMIPMVIYIVFHVLLDRLQVLMAEYVSVTIKINFGTQIEIYAKTDVALINN